MGFSELSIADEARSQGGCQSEATIFKLGDRSSSMDSQLSQLKSPADGVCQTEASPGMFGQTEARPLQWGPEGKNSLIKNCLASPRLGPSHPHANSLNTLESMVESGHLCAMWATQKSPQHFTIVRNQLDLYRSDLNLRNLLLQCQSEASRIFHSDAKLKQSESFLTRKHVNSARTKMF